MTLLRNPFTRAASAFFYRGHNPNSDGFGVRRGVFTGVGEGRAPWHRAWSFRDFVSACARFHPPFAGFVA
jgi:hypothetical protein